MVWVLIGVVLAGFYGFVWALMLTASDADDRAMAEWERQQAEWRKDR